MQKPLFILFLIFLLGIGSIWAQEPSPRDKFHRVSNLFKEAIAQGEGPGVSVAIYYQGIQYFQGFGLRELGKPSEVSPRTLFKTASTSKVLVAYAILKLEKQGELKLEDPIGNYFPEINPVVGQVTIEQLLSHTAGLEDQVDDFGPDGESQHIQYLKDLDESIIFAPGGEVFSYSNPGYNLLGALIERLTRLEFQGAMSTLVFNDFEMKKSTYRLERAYPEDIAWGHYGRGEKTQKIEKIPDNARERASGMLLSNGHDYLNFLAWLADTDKTAHADIRQKLFRIIADESDTGSDWKYGLGLFHRQHCGYTSVEHSGGIPGYRANFVVIPEEKFAIAVLTNGSSLNRNRLIQESTEIMFTRECQVPAKQEETLSTFTIKEQEELLGTFAQSIGSQIRIFQEGKQLRLSRDNQEYLLRKDSQGRIAALEGDKVVHRFAIKRNKAGELAYIQNWVRAYPRVK